VRVPRAGRRVACVAVALLASLAFSAPVGFADATGPSGTSPAPPGQLTADVTYADLGGNWNCGQGHQTFEFYGNVEGGLQPYSYNWTFGDGSLPSSDPSPMHTFERFGEFVVNVSVRDDTGAWLNASVSPIWGISQVCSGSTSFGPLGVWGVALYGALILAILLGVVLVIRVRRRRPPP